MTEGGVSWRDYTDRIFKEHATSHRREHEAAQRTLDLTATALREKLSEMELRIRILESHRNNIDGRFYSFSVGLTVMLVLVTILFRWLMK